MTESMNKCDVRETREWESRASYKTDSRKPESCDNIWIMSNNVLRCIVLYKKNSGLLKYLFNFNVLVWASASMQCPLHTELMSKETKRGCWILWKCNKMLWHMWVLGFEPRSFIRAASALTLQSPKLHFRKINVNFDNYNYVLILKESI